MILIPMPKKMEQAEGSFIIHRKTTIVLQGILDERSFQAAKLLQQEIEKTLHFHIDLTKGVGNTENHIFMKQNSNIEGYRIEITAKNIHLEGKDAQDLLYAVQTLRQIIQQKGYVLPLLQIEDQASIENRGFYHDITRGRVPTLSFLKELVDTLSYYKINQLQLYVEHTFLFREFDEVCRETDPLTADEILELDQYAHLHGIELVPSITTFGHFYRVLSSKSYEHLCELENSFGQPFSFIDRMSHHTINVSNPDSLAFVKNMLDQYIPLFRSNKFNICCDETFDMGKGKSKELKEKIGEGAMYVSFVNQIVKHVKGYDKEVMMWGDIISNHQDQIQELDPSITCLTWDYAPRINEKTIKMIHDHQLKQYVCSGTSGWNHFINPYHDAYTNIKSMALTGYQYQVAGLLNTNWGDFGHVDVFATTLPCLIYGAEFGWNAKEISFEEMNERISFVEYHDDQKQIVKAMNEMSQWEIFPWTAIVGYLESQKADKGWVTSYVHNFIKEITNEQFLGAIANSKKALNQFTIEASRLLSYNFTDVLLMGEAVILFNQLGFFIKNEFFSENKMELPFAPFTLASELESWFSAYKKSWRNDSKESELFRIGDIIFACTDLLRKLS